MEMPRRLGAEFFGTFWLTFAGCVDGAAVDQVQGIAGVAYRAGASSFRLASPASFPNSRPGTA